MTSIAVIEKRVTTYLDLNGLVLAICDRQELPVKTESGIRFAGVDWRNLPHSKNSKISTVPCYVTDCQVSPEFVSLVERMEFRLPLQKLPKRLHYGNYFLSDTFDGNTGTYDNPRRWFAKFERNEGGTGYFLVITTMFSNDCEHILDLIQSGKQPTINEHDDIRNHIDWQA